MFIILQPSRMRDRSCPIYRWSSRRNMRFPATRRNGVVTMTGAKDRALQAGVDRASLKTPVARRPAQ